MKIGFIGAGQMAQALAAGIAGGDQPVEFLIHDPAETARAAFGARVDSVETAAKIVVAKNNSEVLANSKVVFLAVKPQSLTAALADVDPAETSDKVLVVSILAGVKIDKIKEQTGAVRVIRVMPNTPCLIGSGASAMAGAADTNEPDLELVQSLMSKVGLVERVSESQLDAVTGLSGSGPAFVLTMIEAMIDGGVLTGLPRDVARRLAIQTVLGSAQLALETGEHPAALRDRVTSPGGTTIAGMKALDQNGFRQAVQSAIESATERSRELGQ